MDADNQRKPKPSKHDLPTNNPPEDDALLPNSAAEEFFVKMNRDFRRPKPSEEAVAAALQAIQTLAGDAAEHDVESAAFDGSAENFRPEAAGETCSKCSAVNSVSNRFCGSCGAVLTRRHKPAARATSTETDQIGAPRNRALPSGEQHVHHHHHHYFPESVTKHPVAAEARATLSGELAAPPLTPNAAAEAAIQKLMIDWTLCCNSKRLDDLVALYSVDAIVLRANLAPAHGRAAIRELLKAALQAGLGDVELQPADAGVLGDIACLTGHSRMLVPSAPGKRTEETGKFLIVARRESSHWKILADSWCIDAFPRAGASPPSAPVVRPPRSK